MKKLSGILVLSLFVLCNIFALEVNESELRGVNDTVEFINYTGPHKVIDSASAIKSIGTGLGNTITPSKSSTAGNRNKYYVVHAVDASETGKLDADILFIGRDATVDHIKNLRRIISGYLQAAYGYSEKDADTLAVFVTVYNAVYRGKYDIYQKKYKTVVTDNLSSSNCGLSVNYKDWPGKSEIVIPLYDVNGGISTVDTSVISDSKVVDSMKEDDDRNVDARKDMVDLKEREADNANEKAQAAQKEAVQEQKELDEKKQEADEAKKEAEEAQKKADEAKKAAEENPDDKQAQKEAEEAQKEADQAKKDAEEKQQVADEQQKKVDEAKQEAKEQQEFADKKQTEAQNERKEIAEDQQVVQEKQLAEERMQTEYGIIIVDEKDMLSRLVKFNTTNGDIVRRSPVSVIRNRIVYQDGDQFVAVAGENTGNGTIKLVLIDQENMEITRESNEILAEDSVLVKDGNNYYCVIDDNGKWVVGKYDSSLTLLLKSNVAVKSETPITVTPSGVVVTDPDGQLRLLSASDLSAITQSSKNSKNTNTGDAK